MKAIIFFTLLTGCVCTQPIRVKPERLKGIEKVMQYGPDCELTSSDIDKDGEVILKKNKPIPCLGTDKLRIYFEPAEIARLEEYIRYLYERSI